MKTVNIFKAQGIGREWDKSYEPIESATIVIDREMPRLHGENTIEEHNQICDKESEALCDILFKTLPGGILDRVVGKMMMRRASSFIVPLPTGKEG